MDNFPYNRAGRGQAVLPPTPKAPTASFDEWGTPYDAQGNSLAEPSSLGVNALTALAAPVNIGLALMGSLSPYDGTEGGEGWRVPPIISEPAAAFARSGESTGVGEDGRFYLPNVQNPQVAQDTLTQLMTVYGGNALNPLARAKSAVARDPAAIGLMDYGKAKYLDWRYPDEPAVDPRNAAQWKQWAEIDTRSRMRMNRADAITQMNQKIQSDIDGIDTGAPSVFNDFTDDFAPLTPSETGYMNALIQSRRPEFDVIDGATKAADDARYNDLVRRSFERFGKHYEALTPDQTRVIRDGVTNRASFNVIDGGLLSDNRPSLMGSALASQADSLPMDQASIRAYRGSPVANDLEHARQRGILWGTSDPEVARSYTEISPDTEQYFIDNPSMRHQPTVSTLDMRFQNPLVINAEGSRWSRISFDGKPRDTDYIAAVAKKRGHDGVIFNNIRDGVKNANTYVALERGTVFDPETGATLFSDNRPSLLGSALASGGEEDILALLGYR